MVLHDQRFLFAEIGSESSPFRRTPVIPLRTLLVSQIVTNLVGFGYVALLYWLKGANWEPAFHPSWPEIGWGIVATGVQILVRVVFRWVPWFREAVRWLATGQMLRYRHFPVSAIIWISLVAGVCEEFIWRGGLQPLVGLWLTALLFAWIHFPSKVYRYSHPQVWVMMLGMYFPVALMFGALYAWRHDLTAPIVCHVLLDIYLLIRSKRLALSMDIPAETAYAS